MPRGYTENFTKDNGLPITVEYEYLPGSDTTYSPMYGAVGGDPCEVTITQTWPNTIGFDRLSSYQSHLIWGRHRWWKRPGVWVARHFFIEWAVWLAARKARLTDSEYERINAWIAENHVWEDPYEPEDHY